MSYHTSKTPSAEDSVLWRICHALDMHPTALAKSLGVSYEKDIKPLLKLRPNEIAIDDDETWWLISEYVSKHLGMLMAVKQELNKHLQKDRAKKILRQTKFRIRHVKK